MRGAGVLALLLALATPAGAETPRRVVSMNLCTDQLAMMLAAPGQLLSVSHLAADARMSAMAEEAGAFRSNHGGAEEIYLMRPDLVVASAYSDRTATDMLQRLGVPVVVFEPEDSLEEVGDSLRRMGATLGREAEAEALAADYEARLARLREAAGEAGPRAALYGANGWTSGAASLAGQILERAGFRNIAGEAGFPHGGVLPLEVLAMARPEAVITSRPYPGGSRAEEIMAHPVVAALRVGRMAGAVEDRDWICGSPHVLRAIDRLAALREAAR